MTNKLIELALLLEAEGLTEEANATYGLMSFAQDSEVSQWQAAWASVSQPPPTQFPGRVMKSMIEGVSGLIASGEAIQGADPEALREAGKAIKKMSKDMDFDSETLKKFSQVGSDPEITKEASGWAGVTRAIPLVGPIFSGIFAIKNIYYGLQELGNVLSSSEQLGVPWYTVLKHENLNTLADRHADNPEDITTLDKLAKSVQVFWDEMISLFINGIDFIKDCIFAIADIMSMGWSVWLDVGLSFVFMGIEMAWESQALKPFKAVVSKIKEGVSEKFREVLNRPREREPGSSYSLRSFGPPEVADASPPESMMAF